MGALFAGWKESSQIEEAALDGVIAKEAGVSALTT